MDKEELMKTKLAVEVHELTGDEAKKQLYQVTLELWRYQDMVSAIYDYLADVKLAKKECFELYSIMKQFETK